MSLKHWLKITIKSDPSLLESISDFLVGVIGAGVEVAAADEPGYGTVNCFIENPDPDIDEIDDTIDKISNHLKELADIFKVDVPEISYEMIGEEDWGKSWKQYFTPFSIVDGLVISPSWEEYSPREGESVITMDPGMAFGTGHHATTSLCLECIRACLATTKSQTLLDVGTGTGILAMAAIRFGAVKAVGIDNDPEAVLAAKQNVQRNRMEDRIEVSGTDLSSLSGQYDIVAANIIHDTLVELADVLARVTMEGGTLILSGILAGEQHANVVAIFTARGFKVVENVQRAEWAAVRLQKEVP